MSQATVPAPSAVVDYSDTEPYTRVRFRLNLRPAPLSLALAMLVVGCGGAPFEAQPSGELAECAIVDPPADLGCDSRHSLAVLCDGAADEPPACEPREAVGTNEWWCCDPNGLE